MPAKKKLSAKKPERKTVQKNGAQKKIVQKEVVKPEDMTKEKDDEMIKKAREIAEQIQAEAKSSSEEDILKDLPMSARSEAYREQQKVEFPAEQQPEIQEKAPEPAAPEPTPRYDETLASVTAQEEKPQPVPEIKTETEEKQPVVEPVKKEQKYDPDAAFSSLFTNSDPESKKKKLILLFVIVALITVGVSTMAFYYASRHPSSLKIPSVAFNKPTPTPTSAPTPTPTPAPVAVSSYSVEVLNGSGTAGEAGKVADLLKSAGFSSPKTGNADSYNFTKTEVQLSSKVPSSVYDAINKALSGNYAVEKSSTAMPSSSSYDIIVTVGSSSK